MSRPEKQRRIALRYFQPTKERLRPARGYDLDELPPEVLEMVLRFLPYRTIAGCVRLVSKRCSSVSTTILNSAFLSAGGRLGSVLRHLEFEDGSAPSELKSLTRVRVRNSLELVKAQYDLLRAVVWRYTHPPRRQKFARLCFYGGQILDELDRILRMARLKPEDLFDKDGIPMCITAFGVMCKRFMNYFEKVSERKINRNSCVSGCKPVDVLDCLLAGREIRHFRMTTARGSRSSIVNMKLRYVMERSWFTCLSVPGVTDEEDSWRDRQRFMYLRLRRLVGSINEHWLERRHYERELSLHVSDVLAAPKPPPCSTYSGYGEYAGRFFYYGNMNECAYDSKVIDVWRRNSLQDRMRKNLSIKKPNYDLVIDVELRCSPELAPLALRSMLKCDDFENSAFANNHRPELYLRLDISCSASVCNKLPGNFVWELRAPRCYRPD